MLTSETKRRIDACRDVLVGKLPLPTDQVELITLALIYKFMDDLDEESVKLGGKRSFFTGELAKYRWRNLLAQTVSAEERVSLFSEGVEALGHPQKAAHLPGLFRDLFRNAFLKFRDGRILTLFLTEVNGFAYSHSEELGNAFEYLLQCMGTQGENGQFRTPRHIIDFSVACLDPQPGDRILDPACGTGGFLVSAYKHILARYTSPSSTIPGDQLTHAQRQQLYSNLIGYDITDLMVKLSKVNLFLHGFPDPAIHIYDTLSNDARWHEKADLILANPPFMTPKGGVTPHTRFRIAAKKAEVLFTDYIAEHLTPDGRGGVIVPNGIVATTQNAYVKLRRFLVEDSLVAVVSLPAGVFKPYSGVKTSILFLDKKLARQTKEILFLKITADGFDLGDKRTPIEANDLPEAERVVKAWFARAKGPASYQHGAAPHEPAREKPRGLKARFIAAAHESGLQPSNMLLNDAPGALPQAGMRSAVGAGVVWKAIEKKALLEHRACTLQAEPFLGNGPVASDSSVVRLANVVEINPGKTEARSLPPETQVSFVPMEDLLTDRPDFTPTRIRPIGEVITGYTCFRDRDVLLAKITPCFENGKAAIAAGLKNGIGFGSTEFYVLRASDQILPEFLYQVVKRQAFRDEGTENMAGTAGQQRVRRDFIEDYEIPLPSLEEQRRIVAEIEGYQKVLDGARQILAGYSPRFEIDPDWPTNALGEAATIATGGTPSKANVAYWKGNIPWVSPKDMKTNVILDTEDHVSSEAVEGSATRLVPKGTVLCVVRSGILQHTLPVAITGLKVCFNQDINAITPNPKMLDAKFLFYLLKTQSSNILRDGIKGGVTVQSFHNGFFKTYEVPLPPLEEQRRIVAELDAEAAQMDAVRSLIPRFEAKIQRVLDRVWGNAPEANA